MNVKVILLAMVASAFCVNMVAQENAGLLVADIKPTRWGAVNVWFKNQNGTEKKLSEGTCLEKPHLSAIGTSESTKKFLELAKSAKENNKALQGLVFECVNDQLILDLNKHGDSVNVAN